MKPPAPVTSVVTRRRPVPQTSSPASRAEPAISRPPAITPTVARRKARARRVVEQHLDGVVRADAQDARWRPGRPNPGCRTRARAGWGARRRSARRRRCRDCRARRAAAPSARPAAAGGGRASRRSCLARDAVREAQALAHDPHLAALDAGEAAGARAGREVAQRVVAVGPVDRHEQRVALALEFEVVGAAEPSVTNDRLAVPAGAVERADLDDRLVAA